MKSMDTELYASAPPTPSSISGDVEAGAIEAVASPVNVYVVEDASRFSVSDPSASHSYRNEDRFIQADNIYPNLGYLPQDSERTNDNANFNPLQSIQGGLYFDDGTLARPLNGTLDSTATSRYDDRRENIVDFFNYKNWSTNKVDNIQLAIFAFLIVFLNNILVLYYTIDAVFYNNGIAKAYFKGICLSSDDMEQNVCFFSFGQISSGIISLGQMSIGLFTIGQVSVGLFGSVGQLAASCGYSGGMVATGFRVLFSMLSVATYFTGNTMLGIQFLAVFKTALSDEKRKFVRVMQGTSTQLTASRRRHY